MNEFLERQRLMEEQRRISISNQDFRLKQGDNCAIIYLNFVYFEENKISNKIFHHNTEKFIVVVSEQKIKREMKQLCTETKYFF